MKNLKLVTFVLFITLTHVNPLYAGSGAGKEPGNGNAKSTEKGEEKGTVIATSGPTHVGLLELYSSESCSSCPAADKWVSALKDQKEVWKQFVPIVFHVNYWNHLGWKDSLSSQAMTNRQSDIVKHWPEPSVYTPGMVLDGKEWRNWQQSTSVDEVSHSAEKISLTIIKNGKHEFTVKIARTKSKRNFVVRIAELGMNLSANITGGENAGLHLTHNFVVLDWDGKILHPNESELTFKLAGASTEPKAIAAWIEEEGNPTSLQATGNYL